MPETTLVNPRTAYIKNRLQEINRNASSIILEAGVLLTEYHDNHYYREDGFHSFDDAIDHMREHNQIDFGWRQARNFIAIAKMVSDLAVDPKEIERLGLSKMREIASLKDGVTQQKLLMSAGDMSVAEVQAEVRKLRDKAAGRDTDPLVPLGFKLTATQKQMLDESIEDARRVYALEDNVPAAAVLVDSILADWRSALPGLGAEAIEAAQ